MPYLEKNKNKKSKPLNYKNKLRADWYNKKEWKIVRESFYFNNPLCKLCLEEGKIESAKDIHHLYSPFEEESFDLFLDSDNLISLCKKCHGKVHGEGIELEIAERYYGNQHNADEKPLNP